MLTPKRTLLEIIKYIPEITRKTWDMKECILEMKEADFKHWKQTEWVGFYFEFITERKNIPGIARFKLTVGKTSFDGVAGKSIVDYKTSASSKDTILNDINAIEEVVKKYDKMVYIILKGKDIRETTNELDIWRKTLTGKSDYVLKGESTKRTHRKLKKTFYPEKLLFIAITKKNIEYLSFFKQGKNSDGNKRKIKYKLSTDNIEKFKRAELNLSKIRNA